MKPEKIEVAKAIFSKTNKAQQAHYLISNTRLQEPRQHGTAVT